VGNKGIAHFKPHTVTQHCSTGAVASEMEGQIDKCAFCKSSLWWFLWKR
jgi:hypothetical protein